MVRQIYKALIRFNHLIYALLILVLTQLSGCSPSGSQSDYIETGDLPALEERGQLRILTLAFNEETLFLPREGSSPSQELELARKFAKANGLQPQIIYKKHFAELMPALLNGEGDIIVSNLTVTESRKQSITFTYPLLRTNEVIVGSRELSPVDDLVGLKGKTLGVQPSTSFWETAQSLKEIIQLEAITESVTQDQIYDRIDKGTLALTIEDANRFSITQDYRDDVHVVATLPEKRSIAWGLRPDNTQLLSAANRFIQTHHLTNSTATARFGDWQKIKASGELRLITRNNAVSYFLWRNELMGFEYDLFKEFTRQHNLKLSVIVANSNKQMFKYLENGYGDVIAGALNKTEKRNEKDIAYSRPYNYASQVILQREDEKAIESKGQLAGREVAIRPSSSYLSTLLALQDEGINVEIMPVNEEEESETIVNKVANDSYDITLIDSHLAELELHWRDDIQISLALTEPKSQHWIVRQSDDKLLAQLNKFIKRHYKGLFYNVTYNKYFKNSRQLFNKSEREKTSSSDQLSPYDELIKQHATSFDFDWRLIAAQIYQESQFNPQATSHMGAKGLMQVMPRTAKKFTSKSLEKPEVSIKVGVQYMDWLRDRYNEKISIDEQAWFTLAAFNAGIGHVRDARRLAAEKGLDPNRWFDNVEKAMLLLSKPEYYRNARYGYVRGREPVTYVRKIKQRYEAYVLKTERARRTASL